MNRLLMSAIVLFSSISVSAEESVTAGLVANVAKHVPGVTVDQVKETPVAGIFEVVISGEIYYMDMSARYVIDGDLIDLATKRNFTEETRTSGRKKVIDDLGEEKMVVYEPKKVDHTITVVTDIDCPYCRKLHAEMDQYMSNNVKVRYIFMPLKGKDDFNTTVSVWCAKDRNKALDIAKSGGDLEKGNCENPIQEHLNLSRQIGVRGTPAIILENGQMLPGYVPVNKLVPELVKAKTAMAG